MNTDNLYGFVIIVTVLTIIGSMVSCGYVYSSTDPDCWFAKDPIVCQKIKDGK
jgi:hypothetical protein